MWRSRDAFCLEFITDKIVGKAAAASRWELTARVDVLPISEVVDDAIVALLGGIGVDIGCERSVAVLTFLRAGDEDDTFEVDFAQVPALTRFLQETLSDFLLFPYRIFRKRREGQVVIRIFAVGLKLFEGVGRGFDENEVNARTYLVALRVRNIAVDVLRQFVHHLFGHRNFAQGFQKLQEFVKTAGNGLVVEITYVNVHK